MTRLTLLAGAALLALSAAAHAADIPAPCDPRAEARVAPATRVGVHIPDPRNRCIPYVPGQVIRLYAAPGASMMLTLPATERIIYYGKSDNSIISGEAPPRDPNGGDDRDNTTDRNLMLWVPGGTQAPMNFLNLKPLRHLEPQPFTVLAQWTNPVSGATEVRQHMFDLRTRSAIGEGSALGEDVPDTFFGVTIVDPAGEALIRQARWNAEAPARRAAAEARAEANAVSLVRGRLRTVSTASAGLPNANTSYFGQGSPEDRAALAPARDGANPAIWDDGERTYLRYPGNMPVPMVYQVIGGVQGLVAHHVEDDPTTNGKLLVVHGVLPMLRLRDAPGETGSVAAKAAERVLCIVNRRFDPRGRNTGTGTTSPDVIREWREPARVATR